MTQTRKALCGALLFAALAMPTVSLRADVTARPVNPVQIIPNDSTTTTTCNSPCSGQVTCGSGETACCCRANATSPWSCACKYATDCTPSNNCQ